MAEVIDGVQQPKPTRISAARRVRRRARSESSRVTKMLIVLAAIGVGVALLLLAGLAVTAVR